MDLFIPKGWEEVSFRTYLELLDIDLSDASPFTKNLEKLCTLSESDDWEDQSSILIQTTIIENNWLNNTPNIDYKDEIGQYKMKPYSQYTLAEWIRLDTCISNKNYSGIIALAYRKVDYDNWDNVIYEPYTYSSKERIEEFIDEPVTNLFGVLTTAIEFRSKTLKDYNSIFGSLEDEDFEEDEEDKKYSTPAEINQQRLDIKKENVKKKFAWEALLQNISGGNWSEIEKILSLPALFIFHNLLAQKVIND